MLATPETETVEVPSLTEAAVESWARKAKLETEAATVSFRKQIFQKLKIRSETYEIDTQMFDEVEPKKSIGAEIDGIQFALLNGQELGAVIWSCADPLCEMRELVPVSDLVTLGRALVVGQMLTEKSPKCERHSKRKLRS